MRHTFPSLRRYFLMATAFVGFAGWHGSAQATLTLTATAISDGFSLSTFVSGFPDTNNNGTGVGPISVGFPTGGGTLVSSFANNSILALPNDTDGQVYGGGTVQAGFSAPAGIVTIGGVVYVANQGGGTVQQLNSDGSVNQTIVSNLGNATGMAANPANGHIFVSNVNDTIFDVDPIAKTATHFISGVNADGLTVSPDGTTLFAEVGQHILGYKVSDGTQIFDSGFISQADGAAAAVGALAGNLFVNTNNGDVYEVNETTLTQTLIASGGTRGDLVTIDPNGTLLLSQSNEIDRLTLPAGSGFTSTPEPASLTLLGAGMAAIGMLRRRKR